MKIIAAGYSKTGTKSLTVALNQLGYNVYDMLEHFWYHGKEWQKLLIDGGSVEDFKEMYKNVDAAVDVPVFCFWRQIHEAFPDAKIILTVRDEEKWYKSWHKQTSEVNDNLFLHLMESISPSGRKYYQHVKAFCPPAYGFALTTPWHTIPINKAVLINRYRQHYEDVMKNAPKDKLLIYNIKDGWEPLCEFLGREIPDQPFPHENVGGKVIELFIKKNPIMQRIFKETIVVGSILVLASFILPIVFYKMW